MLQFAEALYGLYATDEEGQGLVEYVLLLGFVAVTMFAALGYLKDQILAGYSGIVNGIPTN